MVNYQNSKIYKIVCDETNTVYFGSTTQSLSVRLAGHKSHKNCMVKDMTNPKIYLIEDYPCDRKEQLIMRERYYIENNECINKRIPGRTHKERHQVNKESIQIFQKQYYQNVIKNNLEKLEDRKKYKKTYRDKKYMYTCECGSVVLRETKNNHFKTKKHQNFIS